jgi:hypothetical protein
MLIHPWKPLVRLTGGRGPALGRGGRQDSQTHGEIMPARAYRRMTK